MQGVPKQLFSGQYYQTPLSMLGILHSASCKNDMHLTLSGWNDVPEIWPTVRTRSTLRRTQVKQVRNKYVSRGESWQNFPNVPHGNGPWQGKNKTLLRQLIAEVCRQTIAICNLEGSKNGKQQFFTGSIKTTTDQDSVCMHCGVRSRLAVVGTDQADLCKIARLGRLC